MRNERRKIWVGILYGVVGAVASVAIQWVLWPWVGPSRFIIIYPGVIVSSLVGGIYGGLAAVFVGAILAVYFFFPPTFTFAIEDAQSLWGVVVFLMSGALVASITEAFRRRQYRLQLVEAQRSAERESLQLLEKVELAQSFGGTGFWEWDVATGATTWSKNVSALFELGPQEMPSFDLWMRTVHPDDRTKTEASFREAARMHSEVSIEWRVADSNAKKPRWLTARGKPVSEAGGETLRYVGIVLDITDLKRTEQTLKESEAQQKTIVSSLTDGVVVSDVEGKFVHWNPAALEMHGFASEDEARVKLHELRDTFELRTLSGELLPLDQWPLARILRGEVLRDWEVVVLRKQTNDRKVFSYGGSLVQESAGRPFLAIVTVRDVTERNRTQEQLQEAMQKLNSLLDNSPVGIIEWSTGDFKISRWSSEAERIFGWTAEEVLGKRLEDLGLVFKEDIPVVEGLMADMISGRQPQNVNLNRNYRKDGSVIYCEWYNSTVTEKGGVLKSVLSLVLDVTEEKRLETELRSAVESRDEFLSVASHELKTPLTALFLQLQILQRTVRREENREERVAESLDRAIGSTQQLIDLINELLDLTRIRAGKLNIEKTEMDLREAVQTAVQRLAEDAAQKGSTISLRAGQSIIGQWDPSRVDQIIINLLSNAIKYGNGKPIEITVEKDDAGRAAILKVWDQGVGIPAEMHDKIFERFERATGSTRIAGLGLGLYIVRKIVEAHGGSIRVESEPNKGALFICQLPLKG